MGAFVLACVLAIAPSPPADSTVATAAYERPTEWGAEAGYGFMAHLNRGHANERVVLFEPSVGLPLGSHFDYTLEGHFARYLEPQGYMVGLMPVGVRYSIGSGPIKPYFSLGAGFGWTDLVELEEIDRRFNFLLQASVGIRKAVSTNEAWTLEGRLSHVSNAGTAGANLGLNTVVILTGWRFR